MKDNLCLFLFYLLLLSEFIFKIEGLRTWKIKLILHIKYNSKFK